MARSTAFGGTTGTYDAFLYASIDEDQHGVPLTVLSAFARRNVDPWEEAARLGRLPAPVAVRELAALIAGIAAGPIARADPETIAARLQALLPRSAPRGVPDGHSPEAGVRRAMTQEPGARRLNPRDSSPQPVVTELKARNAVSYFLFYLVFVVLLICSQWMNFGGETKARAEKPAVERQTPVASPSSRL